MQTTIVAACDKFSAAYGRTTMHCEPAAHTEIILSQRKMLSLEKECSETPQYTPINEEGKTSLTMGHPFSHQNLHIPFPRHHRSPDHPHKHAQRRNTKKMMAPHSIGPATEKESHNPIATAYKKEGDRQPRSHPLFRVGHSVWKLWVELQTIGLWNWMFIGYWEFTDLVRQARLYAPSMTVRQ